MTLREDEFDRDWVDNSMSLYEFCQKWDIDLKSILDYEEYKK